MAIAYKSAGAGVATETSGAACSPASPAVVDAGDILIIHAYFAGVVTTPATPSGFTLLDGPRVIETTIGRHWIFGKIAAGTEDGAANALGSQAVVTMRSGRCYSFSGRVAGTIDELVPAASFSATSHATDPQMPTVTTTIAGALAVAAVVQNDNNALGAATGATGGTWAEAVAEFVAALTPGLVLQLQWSLPTANPGTITGGAVAATNDPSGVIGFEIRPSVPASVFDVDVTEAAASSDGPGATAIMLGALTEAAGASDAPVGVAVFVAAAADAAAAGESANATVESGTVHAADITEAASSSDAGAVMAVFASSLTEAAAAGAAQAGAAVFVGAIAEPASAADQAASAAVFAAAGFEAASLSDAPTATAVRAASVLEGAAAADTVAGGLLLVAGALEAAVLAESADSYVSQDGAVLEVLALADGLDPVASYELAVAEAAILADLSDATVSGQTAVLPDFEVAELLALIPNRKAEPMTAEREAVSLNPARSLRWLND